MTYLGSFYPSYHPIPIHLKLPIFNGPDPNRNYLRSICYSASLKYPWRLRKVFNQILSLLQIGLIFEFTLFHFGSYLEIPYIRLFIKFI
ncbi:hypothetical protein JR316_0007244 [Psilocybe cubensis]|uniref:Uncharacterized protein n=1 Tax=Psilocybe cubensis TaxID=181762 RepID=A0ACB8GYV4_PSICU|nr:hypothetical protein JR316_0007244 [Psilocybe cubensis]KAH9480644.1 hypothetical protein JR316_0007244 [Psilocybe cubensis]